MKHTFYDGGDWTVLMAEDDKDAQYFISRAFRKAGVLPRLQVVHDGQEAIEYLDGINGFADRTQHPLPALVLLDLNMPRRNGFEVLKWIREHRTFKRMVVVIFTTSDEPKDINRAYDLGANSYLIKTPMFPEFVEIVKDLHKYWTKHNRMPELT